MWNHKKNSWTNIKNDLDEGFRDCYNVCWGDRLPINPLTPYTPPVNLSDWYDNTSLKRGKK